MSFNSFHSILASPDLIGFKNSGINHLPDPARTYTTYTAPRGVVSLTDNFVVTSALFCELSPPRRCFDNSAGHPLLEPAPAFFSPACDLTIYIRCKPGAGSFKTGGFDGGRAEFFSNISRVTTELIVSKQL
ncbi:MAG: hypothetical protein DRP66_02380 [Planctomycetota bacterium]|nr:MAG: hypothetical protein DRP66_02380 [Planctomycetota bacterium]